MVAHHSLFPCHYYVLCDYYSLVMFGSCSCCHPSVHVRSHCHAIGCVPVLRAPFRGRTAEDHERDREPQHGTPTCGGVPCRCGTQQLWPRVVECGRLLPWRPLTPVRRQRPCTPRLTFVPRWFCIASCRCVYLVQYNADAERASQVRAPVHRRPSFEEPRSSSIVSPGGGLPTIASENADSERGCKAMQPGRRLCSHWAPLHDACKAV